jgi:hypothetical protein
VSGKGTAPYSNGERPEKEPEKDVRARAADAAARAVGTVESMEGRLQKADAVRYFPG